VNPADTHIANAQAYARQITYERVVLEQMTAASITGAPLPRELAAAQGEHLRLTIVECTRAIVAAIREPPSHAALAALETHREEVARVAASLALAETPEDRHGTYAHRHSTNALRHDTTRSVEDRRRDWLHTHAGEPLPPELRTPEEAHKDAGGS
jgi:hypothetical protein